MMNNVFFDSNIWIYFFQKESDHKVLKIDDLLQNNNVFLSTQVVNEVIKVLRGKYNFSHGEIRDLISYFFNEYEVIILDQNVMNLGVTIRESFLEFDQNRSFWDSNIVAAAAISGCDIVYSEDWQHNSLYRFDRYSIRVINPFLEV